MILFKPEHVGPILSGLKWQTRRTWKRPRVRVGSIHQARTELFGKPFARLHILALRQETLGDISPPDARAEGYDDIERFQLVWRVIHGEWLPSQPVWVVEFEVVR